MLGTDILPLQAIARKTQSYEWRRLHKILSPVEISNNINYHDPRYLYLLFWTIKESAYKAIYKQKQIREFAPKKYICNLKASSVNKEQWHTVLIHEGLSYHVKVKITEEYICAISASSRNMLGRTKTIVRKINEQSEDSGLHLRAVIRDWFTTSHMDSQIIEQNEYPLLKLNGKLVGCSLSHHYPWAAFTYTN